MTVTTRYRVSLWNDEQWEGIGPWHDTFEEAEAFMHETIDDRSPYARVIEERVETTWTIKARATFYAGPPEGIVTTLSAAPPGHA